MNQVHPDRRTFYLHHYKTTASGAYFGLLELKANYGLTAIWPDETGKVASEKAGWSYTSANKAISQHVPAYSVKVESGFNPYGLFQAAQRFLDILGLTEREVAFYAVEQRTGIPVRIHLPEIPA